MEELSLHSFHRNNFEDGTCYDEWPSLRIFVNKPHRYSFLYMALRCRHENDTALRILDHYDKLTGLDCKLLYGLLLPGMANECGWKPVVRRMNESDDGIEKSHYDFLDKAVL